MTSETLTPAQLLFKRLTKSARWPTLLWGITLTALLWAISAALTLPFLSPDRLYGLAPYQYPWIGGNPVTGRAGLAILYVTHGVELLSAIITASLAAYWAGTEVRKQEEYALLYLGGLAPDTAVRVWFNVTLFRLRLAYILVVGLIPAMLVAKRIVSAISIASSPPILLDIPIYFWLLSVIRMAAAVGIWQAILLRNPGLAALAAPFGVLFITGLAIVLPQSPLYLEWETDINLGLLRWPITYLLNVISLVGPLVITEFLLIAAQRHHRTRSLVGN